MFGFCSNNWREWLHLALVLGNPLVLDALGQEEPVCTGLAVGVGPVLPFGALAGFTGMCSQSQVSWSLRSRQVGLGTSSELQSNINVQSIMCTTRGFYVGSPALQDA